MASLLGEREVWGVSYMDPGQLLSSVGLHIGPSCYSLTCNGLLYLLLYLGGPAPGPSLATPPQLDPLLF